MTWADPSTTVGAVRHVVLRWSPAALGLAAATFQIRTGVAVDAVAITIAVAASCYLAAAALGRPWVAWIAILAGSTVVTVSEFARVSWWLGLTAFAGVLLVIGVARRTDARALILQGLAMVGFGGLAVTAVLISPRFGLALAGGVLTSHAAWDYLHWRRREVVPRSLAEFCFLLDIPFGMAALVLAFTGDLAV